jgi:type IV pilus assembly protein PilC
LRVETAKFARTLAALLTNGVPMLAALDVVAGTLGNRKVAADVVRVREAVEKGSGIGEALEQHTLFASTATSLVRIGESSGATPQMLEKIASVYEREVDRTARALTTMLEPVLIVVMGGCVAFIVMSILLPVFRLNLAVQ